MCISCRGLCLAWWMYYKEEEDNERVEQEFGPREFYRWRIRRLILLGEAVHLLVLPIALALIAVGALCYRAAVL